jgi:hypothetical protein
VNNVGCAKKAKYVFESMRRYEAVVRALVSTDAYALMPSECNGLTTQNMS